MSRTACLGALSVAIAVVTGCDRAASPGLRHTAPQGVSAPEASPSTPPDVREIRDWVVESDDNAGLPFLIIDKRRARIHVYDARGMLRASAPILLGAAKGDHSVPGIGERPLRDIRPEEKTTPAGRFLAQRGRNLAGEDIVWVDYEAAVSIHRVRTKNPGEQRAERLASPTILDNRISFGCINVPAEFYDAAVDPVLARGRAFVYILPETMPAAELFLRPGSLPHDAT